MIYSRSTGPGGRCVVSEDLWPVFCSGCFLDVNVRRKSLRITFITPPHTTHPHNTHTHTTHTHTHTHMHTRRHTLSLTLSFASWCDLRPCVRHRSPPLRGLTRDFHDPYTLRRHWILSCIICQLIPTVRHWWAINLSRWRFYCLRWTIYLL